MFQKWRVQLRTMIVKMILGDGVSIRVKCEYSERRMPKRIKIYTLVVIKNFAILVLLYFLGWISYLL